MTALKYKTPAANEVQLLEATAYSSGTAAITLGPTGSQVTTAPIAGNASAATFQAAVDAVAGAGKVLVTGGVINVAPGLRIEYIGAWGGTNVPALTVGAGWSGGGPGPATVITTVTEGASIVWKTLTMPTGVHIGPEAPDPAVKPLWVDTDDQTQPSKKRFDYVAAAPPWNLGSFDGANIAGIRISMHGRLFFSTANPFLMVTPNGLATIQANFESHRFYWSGGINNHDVVNGGNIAARNGMFMTSMVWTNGPDEIFGSEMTIFTQPQNGVRVHYATSIHRDTVTDGNRILRLDSQGQWSSSSDQITSLVIGQTGGSAVTFTGRVTTETF